MEFDMTVEERNALVGLVCSRRHCIADEHPCPIHIKTIKDSNCYDISDRAIIYICMDLYKKRDKKFLDALERSKEILHNRYVAFNKYCRGVEYEG